MWLSAIRGAVQLMQRELGDEARWGEYTAVLLKEVTRVNSIIEMLLDLGRPVTLRTVPLNVHQLLERVALLLEEEATSLGIQFVRRYDPSLPPIMADEDLAVEAIVTAGDEAHDLHIVTVQVAEAGRAENHGIGER